MYCSLFVYFSAFTRLIDKNGGFHMKPYITMEEVIETQGADSRTHRFLTERMAVPTAVLLEQLYMHRQNSLISRESITTRKAFMY